MVKEVVREEVRDESVEEDEDGPPRQPEVGGGMEEGEQTDVRVWAVVRQGIGRWLQQTMERFMEGLEGELEDLNFFGGINNHYVVKM